MELYCSGTENQVCIQNFFKNFDRSSKTRFPYVPAPVFIVLDKSDTFGNILSQELSAFLFGLLAVESESKYNSDVLVLCSTKVKLFE